MTSELKPCPFCGGKAEFVDLGGSCSVVCSKCWVTNERLIADESTYLGYMGYRSREDSIEAWNRRANDEN